MLDVADEQPEGVAFLIPVRLEECEIPERLKRWQWVDLFDDDGYTRLLRGLGVSVFQREIRTPGVYISYRRADEPEIAGLLYDRLKATFPYTNIYIDV